MDVFLFFLLRSSSLQYPDMKSWTLWLAYSLGVAFSDSEVKVTAMKRALKHSLVVLINNRDVWNS